MRIGSNFRYVCSTATVIAGFSMSALLMSCGADTGDTGSSGNGSGNGNPGSGDGNSNLMLPDELMPNTGNGNGSGVGADEIGCKFIDIVFSIDNSGSMVDEQRVMGTEIFPKFADKLMSLSSQIDSFRVGVLDACPTPATFHTSGRDDGQCNFAGQNSWIDSGSPALSDEFACVGAIDSSDTQCDGRNDDEQPASTAAASLEGGANAGFLRDNAVLVLVAMTDEDEQPAPNQNAQALHDRIVQLKGGDETAVVFLGIAGNEDCTGPYGDADEATYMKELTALFSADQRGVFWDLCTGSLEEGLGEAISAIDRACAEYIPIE